MNSSNIPQIYVVDLSQNKPCGIWIDATKAKEDILFEIENLLSQSSDVNSENYAIQGCRNFSGIKIDEFEAIEEVIALAQAIVKHGDAFALFFDKFRFQLSNAEEATKSFVNNYQGAFESKLDYFQNLIESGNLENFFAPESYTDYTEELFDNQNLIYLDGHVFSNL